MASLHVHNLFLWSMAVIYLFAFASLYHQLPGLYGDKGILPISRELTKTPKFDAKELVRTWLDIKPTLLWVTQSMGLDAQTGMDLLALLGMGLASLAIITRFARNVVVFGALWLLYLSFSTVGSVFLWFQWLVPRFQYDGLIHSFGNLRPRTDFRERSHGAGSSRGPGMGYHSLLLREEDALLLEAGFLAFVFAPIPILMSHDAHSRFSGLCMWPVKWLFFRLMFMSGIVKMQSGCPTWWKLTALHHHYESQCLPTFLAWYVHQMPGWFDQLTVLHALFSEIVVPFLFFAPTRGIRRFAFYNQVILQLGIILTGNYNWFNLLTIVLGLSLLDDEYLGYKNLTSGIAGKVKSVVLFFLNTTIVMGLMAGALYLYNVQYDEKQVLKFKADFVWCWTCFIWALRMSAEYYMNGFTEQDIHRAMAVLWPASVGIALISLLWTLGTYWVQNKADRPWLFTRIYRGGFFLFYLVAALTIFALSLAPYGTISKSAASQLGATGSRIKQNHRALERYSIVNGYGLFRRMTGVDGRPELILEGSNDLSSGWKEYDFYDKPGKLNRAPPFVVPHQPRLDWQMWFAALGDTSSSPWVYNFVYRLLKGQPEVLRLIESSSPFYKKPPKYIRGQLYKYWFTTYNDKDKKSGNVTSDWWKRTLEREWLSPVSLEDEKFLEVVKQQGLTEPVKQPKTVLPELQSWIKIIRQNASTVSAPTFIWSIFMVNVIFHRTLKALRLG